ncbi:uncharacterized protein BP5553_05783 [Venustampulla echinocandica]|uniref:Uncharacterized protein n=1 Tax=Venustampulla echinocandica TaxID=2656787 RepID=A0A370TLN4_9HELO|nr:uncharacterized protein BP5553_05783 [Venustampulla echinocandica]RDL36431.1 hypothetical protein BP5553_05783 [Venustampulla echinocandica]
MTNSKLTLFDIPSKGRRACWSLNPWKTRMTLNFKNIDYQTQWVEYPDIEPTLSPNVPPNPPSSGAPAYTIPAVQFPDSSYLMDSKPIAYHLESLYPSPHLHLESPSLSQVEAIISELMTALAPESMPRAPLNILNDCSAEYFQRKREEKLGMTFEKFVAAKGGEKAWEAAMPAITQLGEVLKKEEGPFVLGTTPSYADFVIAGFLQMLKWMEEKAMFERFLKIEPALGKLYEACGKWLERDDH